MLRDIYSRFGYALQAVSGLNFSFLRSKTTFYVPPFLVSQRSIMRLHHFDSTRDLVRSLHRRHALTLLFI